MITFSVIGAGRVGLTLTKLFFDMNCFDIQSVINKNINKSENAVNFIGAGNPSNDIKSISASDVYMISTPDNIIGDIAAALSVAPDFNKNSIVFHCSGATSSSVLNPLKSKGAKVASVHPLKSFSSHNEATESFNGTFCSIEGDPEAVSILTKHFSIIGASVFSIETEKKAIYHAAGVMVCNNLVALMELSMQMYEQAGLTKEMAAKVCEPFVRGTINNIFKFGTVKALTGPIARGDIGTVRKHLLAIHDKPSELIPYVSLGTWALKLSREKNEATKENLDGIEKLLKV
jgi:predicted short-subunit dehydrogenase-like oxidoreductase (DUF2520 family)